MRELLQPNGVDQSWRVFTIMSEFVEGFNLLKKYHKGVTFWGSARTKPGDKYYDEAVELAERLVKDEGYSVVTGGGGGIMEAGNVGAFKAGGTSIGFNIKLPEEQHLNPYTTDSASFDHFFSRKVMLTYASEVYVYFPGGFGTLDELFEIITLIQTNKIPPIPVVLYGREFWQPLINWMNDTLLNEYKTVSIEDLAIFDLVDSVDEAMDIIKERTNC